MTTENFSQIYCENIAVRMPKEDVAPMDSPWDKGANSISCQNPPPQQTQNLKCSRKLSSVGGRLSIQDFSFKYSQAAASDLQIFTSDTS